MEQLSSELLILEADENIPQGTINPPRKPQLLDTVNYIVSPDQFCRDNLAEYGPIFQTSVFGGKTIFVGESKAIMMVFNGDNNYTEIALPPTTMEMFGEHSLFQRPDLHRERKSALKHGLTGRTLMGYIPKINEIILEGLSQWNNKKEISLYTEIEKISFDIFVPLLLGINLNDDDYESFKDLPITSKNELKQLYKTYFDGFYGLVKWESPLTTYGRGIKARKVLLEFMKAVINKRRKQREKIDPTSDFLAMMLADNHEDENSIFSEILMANQCLLQLWGSHYEVTALMASWIYHLGKYPNILTQLKEEQTKVKNGEIRVNETHLKQLNFLEATIKETLRISPPSSTANRRLLKNVVLNGVLYPKGSTVIAEPRIAHIQAEYFPDPDKFIPERFLPPRNEGKMYQFIPFGGGIHACLGAQMAMIVTQILASLLMEKFTWELTEEPAFIQFPLKRIKENYQIYISPLL